MLTTVVQAARELGLSLKTARVRIQSGEWPVYRFGAKSTRVDVAEIKKLYRKKRVRKIDGENAA